jgi:hypothetical protein
LDDVQEEKRTPRVTRGSLLRDRIMFYAGTVLIVFGALYFALGSYLHDLLHVPIIGEAYTVFGPINVQFALVGLVLLLMGLVLLGLSLRGGSLSHEEVEIIAVEGELQ